jgi:uncharacterized circularly permuted ATP-grasp superfamily protein
MILVSADPLGAPKGPWYSYEIRRAMFQKFPAFYGQATKTHTQPTFTIVEYRKAQVQFSMSCCVKIVQKAIGCSPRNIGNLHLP